MYCSWFTLAQGRRALTLAVLGWWWALVAQAEALPYVGQSLHVLSFQDTHARAVFERLKRFEELSGAKVHFDMVATNEVAGKIASDQAAGGSYDLYTVDEPFVPQLSTFLLPYASWPGSRIAALSGQGEPKDLYVQPALEGGSYQGQLWGLPVNGNVYMYVYRQDLFADTKEQQNFLQRYGAPLVPPTTMEDFRRVAEFFTRPPHLYGFAPFTKASEGTTVEALWIMHSFGAIKTDAAGQLDIDEVRATQALAFYLKLMDFAPPGAGNWHHAERMGFYGKGRLAQIMTWPSYVQDLENPRKSLVVAKNAYAMPPKAEGGKPSPVSGAWIVGIARNSKNSALAAEFARYWTHPEFSRELVAHGMNPARRDLLADAVLAKERPWFPKVLEHFAHAALRPRLTNYQAVSNVISKHFTAAVAGSETPETAIKNLKAGLQALAPARAH